MCCTRLAEIQDAKHRQPECGPMPIVMVAMPNIGGALCSTLVSDIAIFVLKRDVKLQLTN